ncbi:hypothetical protein MKZ38_007545 [Zalerion maritima]|uniref:Uncharacterized protein n=1 Tax=Zalerion maritima TaxID=339359 RepID=A0AAD5WPQ8_9PEZI|nr:hypothetical protein MKZ38_007545 [Zalerion maritima]
MCRKLVVTRLCIDCENEIDTNTEFEPGEECEWRQDEDNARKHEEECPNLETEGKEEQQDQCEYCAARERYGVREN